MKRKGIIFRGESKVLDEQVRASAPGQFAELPDGMVHYEMAGPADAPTVALIPGFSVPYTIWDPTFKALVDAKFRVLRYDLYGRGYSDRPDLEYHQALFDRQLRYLLDDLGVDGPIDLVGLSMGGAIAVVFAEKHPEFVRKLCLLDPAGLHWEQPLTARLAQAPVLGAWIMGLLGGKVLVSALNDYFHRQSESAVLIRAFTDQMQYIGFKNALLSTLRNGVITGAEKAYGRVGSLEIPALLIWGREDRVVPFELSKRVMELIPNIEFHAIDNAAHIPHYECPDVVNPILIAFLSR